MELDREFDRTKVAAFLDSNGAFLGPLLCSLKFQWSENVPTAGVSIDHFYWNPAFFKECDATERVGILMHELWHIARLHTDRLTNRDPEYWNMACDYVINNALIKDGYKLPEGGLIDANYEGKTEEEIYDLLIQNQMPKQQASWGTQIGSGEALESSQTGDTSSDGQTQAEIVQKAAQASKLAAGTVPGVVEDVLKDFFRPKLPWKTILHNYLQDNLEVAWSWKHPNKRFDEYMPSIIDDDGRLVHVAFFLDTSGSISDDEIKAFNSELKYIWEELEPEKLTAVQFDTRIHKTTEFKSGDRFEKIKVHGRGGTCLYPVYQWIKKNKPTLSIIFTDLYCDEMDDPKSPVIWIITSSETPKFGKVIRYE